MAKTSISSRLIGWFGVLLAIVIVAAAAAIYFFPPQSADAGGRAEAAQVALIAQSAVGRAQRAVGGDLSSIVELAESRGVLAKAARAIRDNASADRAFAGLTDNSSSVTSLLQAMDDVVAGEQSLSTFKAASERAERLSTNLVSDTRDLVTQLPAEDLAAYQPYLETLDLAVAGVAQVPNSLGSSQSLQQSMQTLSESRDYIAEIVGGMTGRTAGLGLPAIGESAPVEDVDAVRRLLDETELAIGSMLEEEDGLVALEDATGRIQSAAEEIGAIYERAATNAPAATPRWQDYLPLILLGAGLILLVGLFIAYARARDLRATAELQAEQNERNQQAILRLLDELSNLADGDLTVEATVTEDITGAIADSINYAIEALRGLVLTISESSMLVDAAAKQSEATAHHLVRAAETQAKQSIAASNSIAQMTASVKEVSGNAERSSDVARHSVDVAHKGGEAVRRTIEGMNAIRETIQDTSKRIKRLGESSQEIGNIVELIEEIAEQTNILALNASIEASRAGEASRGFAVVADEVQKLAERSSNATRKIEVLVSTIQSDTNEAIVSMERSTTDVVGGALLAENAGAALDEIEQVSHQIASLVHNISESAREQSQSASAITRNMDVLREVSTKAKQLTTATSSSISKLSALASQLRETVSGFHLPEQTTRTSMLSQLEVAGSLVPPAAKAAGEAQPAEAEEVAAVAAGASKTEEAALDDPSPRQALSEEMLIDELVEESSSDAATELSGERRHSG